MAGLSASVYGGLVRRVYGGLVRLADSTKKITSLSKHE